MITLFFLSSFLSFFLLAKQRGSIATAESVILGAAWGEERLGIAWVSKHHNSEDERVGIGMGWAETTERSYWKRRHAPKL